MSTTDRVADAPSGAWVYRLLPRTVWPYAQLARWDRPIGWWLLLWPCWWSVMLAAIARPSGSTSDIVSPAALVALLALFWLGAVAMRGAGCTYNDLVDRRIDARVARTASRPLPSGRVTPGGAKAFMLAQVMVGFAVLLALCLFVDGFNRFAFALAVASLAIVALYPFAKRVTDWPQLVLGLAFSWGALMGWAVVFGELALPPVLLYAGAVAWTIGYDTIYAHQDKEDDALVGVRSTARLFGHRTRGALVAFYGLAFALILSAIATAGAGWPAHAGVAAGALQMFWQIERLDIDDADQCLRLFRSNTLFGWLVFGGLVADYAL